jgi:hypothetical protein
VGVKQEELLKIRVRDNAPQGVKQGEEQALAFKQHEGGRYAARWGDANALLR